MVLGSERDGYIIICPIFMPNDLFSQNAESPLLKLKAIINPSLSKIVTQTFH